MSATAIGLLLDNAVSATAIGLLLDIASGVVLTLADFIIPVLMLNVAL